MTMAVAAMVSVWALPRATWVSLPFRLAIWTCRPVSMAQPTSRGVTRTKSAGAEDASPGVDDPQLVGSHECEDADENGHNHRKLYLIFTLT